MATIQVAPWVRTELTEYFYTAESELGMRSSFGPLVDAALGGWSTSSDHERAIARRHQLGPSVSTPVSRAREVRTVLLAIGSEHESVLDAAFGMHDWQHMLDDVFGKGAGEKALKKLGRDYVGIALLTEALGKGFERDREKRGEAIAKARHKKPTIVRVVELDDDGWPEEHFDIRDPEWNAKRLDTIGAYLFTLCDRSGDKQLDAVRAEAESKLRAAVAAYGDTVGTEPFVTAESQLRTVRQRRPVGHIERVWPKVNGS